MMNPFDEEFGFILEFELMGEGVEVVNHLRTGGESEKKILPTQ